jgi:hypothetical protein
MVQKIKVVVARASQLTLALTAFISFGQPVRPSPRFLCNVSVHLVVDE